MRTRVALLVAAAACGGPPPARTASRQPPIDTGAPPVPLPAMPSAAPLPSPAPSAALAPAGASTGACALAEVSLPARLTPCTAPGAKPYESEADLVVDVEPFPATVHAGTPVTLTLTMKNATHAPLELRLSDPQTPAFEVSVEGDPNAGPTETIEPLPQPPSAPRPPSCAHVACDHPLLPAPPRASPAVLTLAPGGVARVRGTWSPRRWRALPPEVHGCCDVVPRAPVAVGPLGPGTYIVQMRAPLDEAYDGDPGVPRARADIEIVP